MEHLMNELVGRSIAHERERDLVERHRHRPTQERRVLVRRRPRRPRRPGPALVAARA